MPVLLHPPRKEIYHLNRVYHNIPPVFNADCRALVLGSFPSPKSRETGFYYGHPQNRFWPVISQLLEAPLPQTNEEKTRLLLDNRIAVWDVLESCEITGASDSAIKNPKFNDIAALLAGSKISAVFCTGRAAHKFYSRYSLSTCVLPGRYLPSTSAANAGASFEHLSLKYAEILHVIRQK